MRCPHCGRPDVPEGAKFCIDCGASIQRRSSSGSLARPRVSESSLIIDYDDVRPSRRPRARSAALIGLGVVVVGLGVWLTLSSLGASPPADLPASPPSAAPAAAPIDSTPPPAPTPAPAPARAEPGLLSLNAVPWGRVSIDGRVVGNTPVLDLRVAPGAHRVRVERPGFEPYERDISVVAGQRLRITDISLAKQRRR